MEHYYEKIFVLCAYDLWFPFNVAKISYPFPGYPQNAIVVNFCFAANLGNLW